MNADSTKPETWTVGKRVGFRFAFVLFVLLYAPSPLDSAPLLDKLASAYLQGRLLFGAWIATHVLHIVAPVGTSYTGDGVLGWVLLGVEVASATVACIAWSALGRRALAYPCLLEGLRVYLRFMLASILFGYGFAKIFCVQFPPPSTVILLQTFGEASPMNLLWTFMGASRGYQIFGGLAEALGATLLLFRRTTMLGALLLVGVLGNVVALNVFYDVGVKIYSATLLGTAIFLALPDIGRLARFFLSNAIVPDRRDLQLLPASRGRIVATLAKTAFVIAVVLPMGWSKLQQSRAQRSSVVGALAGFYEADRPAEVVSQSHHWTALEFTGPFLYVHRADGSSERFLFPHYDAQAKTLAVYDRARAATYTFAADVRDAELSLSGHVETESVDAHFSRAEPPRFPLTAHDFHWVNEPH